MANSKYEYVRAFEREEILLPNTWIVVRIDGRGFHKLSTHYAFTKPNDARALHLMNAAAMKVMSIMYDVVLAYGVSDEYSFVFERDTKLFDRRRDKLVSTVVSTFTAAYVGLWDEYFGHKADVGGVQGDEDGNGVEPNAYVNAGDGPDDVDSDPQLQPHPHSHSHTHLPMPPSPQTLALSLSHLPTFDARAILYPATHNLRDYLSWRQVDCHINNLYNTTFWSLVQLGGMGQRQAEEFLKGTVASGKNEILFTRFGINYNNEGEMFRKGSVVYREYADAQSLMTGESAEAQNLPKGEERGELSKTQQEKRRKAKAKAEIVVRHCDIIKDVFWDKRPWLLGGKGSGRTE